MRLTTQQMLHIALYSLVAIILFIILLSDPVLSRRQKVSATKPRSKASKMSPVPRASAKILLSNNESAEIASNPLFRQGLGDCSQSASSQQVEHKYPTTSNDEAALNQVRFDRCYHNSQRFFFFGNNWGRHFNHVTSVVAALVLSKAANRTLVLPVFYVEKQVFTMADLYNVTSLFDIRSSPFCVLAEDEFYELELESRKSNGMTADEKRFDVQATCISMRGIKMHPQLPQKFGLKCTNEVFIKYKKNLTLFYETVVTNRKSPAFHARFLTVPLVIYYAEVLPKDMTACPWKLIQPHGVVMRAVDLFSSLGKTIGIHIRSLEGSCRSRVAGFPAEQRLQLERQCKPNRQYVEEIVNATSTVDVNKSTVIIADDGQSLKDVTALLAQFSRGVRPQSLVETKHRSQIPYKGFFLDLRKGKIRRQGHLFPFLMAPHHYANVESFLIVQVDFWLLALSDVFIGNQMSTLSQNVCRWRLATGRLCNNFV